MVGRERDLADIARLLRDTSVVVLAPAGMGKSRLAREAVAAEEQGGALTGWVQATRSAAAIPLGAFAGLLPDDVRTDEPVQIMQRSTEALLERAGRRRVVVGVDDAQLLDPVSAALVLHLARQGVRVLATVRSGEPAPDAIVALVKEGEARQLEVAPLSDRDVTELVEFAVGGPLEEAALRWVAGTSRGNPLYVRELVVSALQSQALAPRDGLWRLSRRPQMSASLRDLITSRIAELDARQRAPVELLSLSEPLTVAELAALTSLDTLVDAEARGLVVVEAAQQVRLAHPLFGEVVSGTLPSLRARQLRGQLAAALQRREPLTPDDALRVVRLLLDAGGEIPSGLRLLAARAANLAGDPDLGAELVALALEDGGLEAALLLARAHMLRGRSAEAEAAFAAAEPLVTGDPRAIEYLRARTWNLTWGLHRVEDTLALLVRAREWSPDPAWRAHVDFMRRVETAITDGFAVVDEVQRAVADPALPADERLVLESFASQTALYSGDGVAAAAIARRIRPQAPLRSLAEAAALAGSTLVTLETGID
jgi:type II secretory pathway predicted ATPase ExeA